MEIYKLNETNAKDGRIKKIADFIKVNKTEELFGTMPIHQLPNNPFENIDAGRNRVSRLLGTLHSTNISHKVLFKNLKELFLHLLFFNEISDLIEPSDIDCFFYFSKDKKFADSKVKELADQILVVLLFYPDFTKTLIDLGLLKEITTDFMNDQYLGVLSFLCGFKKEIRDTVFEMEIPQQLVQCIYPVNGDFPNKNYIVISDFAASLCSHSIENENELNVIHMLFEILCKRIVEAPIDVENAILKATIKYAVFNNACFNSFTKFGLFNYFSHLKDSLNQQNLIYFSNLFLAVVEYEPGFAKHLVENENAWNIVLQLFVKIDSNSLLLIYTKPIEHILEAAIIMTFVDVDRFVDIFGVLLSKYEFCAYQIKSKIGSIFYAAMLNATASQMDILFNAPFYLNILFENFPDPDMKWFTFLAQGLLNLLSYVESIGKDSTCFVAENIFANDSFEPWIMKCEAFKCEQGQNTNQSEMCNILVSTFSSFQKRITDNEQ